MTDKKDPFNPLNTHELYCAMHALESIRSRWLIAHTSEGLSSLEALTTMMCALEALLAVTRANVLAGMGDVGRDDKRLNNFDEWASMVALKLADDFEPVSPEQFVQLQRHLQSDPTQN